METYILFFVAAVVGGLINSLAGGGGLITFPLLALVVPPVVADATSALALLPAYPGAVWRTRDRLQEIRRLWLWLLLVTSALGGLVGALLLVWTGDRNFEFLVPWLVFGGTVLFVLEPRLSRHSGDASHDRGLATALWPLAAVVVFVVAIYGGYFGAGIGILMISALSSLRMGDVHRVVPFPTSLLGDYGDHRLLVAIYAATLAVGRLLLTTIHWYSTRNDQLLGEPQDPATVRFFLRRGLTIPAIFLLSIAISFFSVTVAICSWLIMLAVDAVVIHRRFR